MLLHQMRSRCRSCPDSKIKKWKPRRKMAHKRPRIQPDGSIIYARKGVEPPPDIVGYVRDPGNSFRFIPKWFSCDYRVQLPYVKPCGNETVKSFCGHTQSPVGQGNEVTLQICEACPLNKCRA